MKRGILSRFRRDTRGVSAVEFALIAPVIVLMYAGTVQVCQAFMSDKRSGHAASIVADMVAQNASLSRSQVENVMGVGDRIMRPFPADGLTLRVTSVTNEGGDAVVDWSQRRGGAAALAAWSKGDKIDVPAGLLADGDSLIIVNSQYAYQPMIKAKDVVTPATFDHTAYYEPRFGSVACADC